MTPTSRSHYQDTGAVGECFAPAPPVRFWKTEAFETGLEQKDCCLCDRKKKKKKLWQLCYSDTSKQLEVSSDEGRSEESRMGAEG